MMNLSIFLESEKLPASFDFQNAKRVVIAPGRFNPPHSGHELMIHHLVALGKKLEAEPIILIIDSGKRDERNPLTGKDREKYLRKVFPNIKIEIAHNAYDAVELLKSQGMVPVGGVSGSDRADNYKKMVGRIFGKDMVDYHADVLKRDPDAEDVAGVSASKVRHAASQGDIAKFRSFVSLKNRDDVVAMYDAVRKGMGVK